MKKILMLLFLIFALFIFLFIAKNICCYKYLENGIYYKMGTLKNENGFKTAEFKTINDENSTYEFIKYRAYCDNKGLKIMHSKTYSANGTLLEEFITN